MGFLTKIELKKQLQQLGIQVEGNYIRKSHIKKTADQYNENILAPEVKADTDARFTSSTGQYNVYVMSEDEGKEAGRTVPTGYALKRSTRTNKKIKLTITGYKDTTKNIANALKLAGLIDRSATEKDIEYDGDENEIGVWYKEIYRFTLIKE